MPTFSFLRMAWDSIRDNKVRSGLTLLGIVIGVFAVIASVTAVKVIDVYFEDTIDFLGSTTFVVQKYPGVNFGRPDESIRNRPNITYEQMRRLEDRASLPIAVSPDAGFGNERVYFGDRRTDPDVRIRGSDPQWPVNQNYELGEGRFFSQTELQFATPVVVLGATVAEELFPNQTPLGKRVRFGGNRFRVVGVLAEKGSAFGQDQDNLVVAPITRMLAVAGQRDRDISIQVQAPSVPMLGATQNEVIGHMRTIRQVPPGEENNFEIITNESLLDAFSQFTTYMTLGGAAVGLVSLLAAGVGIMNIMLVSVTERIREIGIRKSVGATRRAILIQFLLEAIVLCQIGGLIGIGLGTLGGNVLAFYFDIGVAFPWGWAVGGILGLTGFAVTFGMYPAYKAAQQDPISALRYE